MRIVAHHTKFYDWEPVPHDVAVTKTDIAAGKVKPSGNGGWLMPVTKEPKGGTHTEIHIPERQIIAKAIHDKCRAEGGRTLTRAQCVAFYVSEHVLPNAAHRSWLTKFEVHDDGPDEALAREMFGEHVAAGNIPEADLEAHVAAYLEKADHAEHLAKHFKVKGV